MQRKAALAFIIGTLLLTAAGCLPQPVFTPTPTKTPDPSLVLHVAEVGRTDGPPLQSSTAVATTEATSIPTMPQPTLEVVAETPTSTPDLPTPTPGPSLTPPPPDDGLPSEHYWLQRPIPEGWTNYLDRTYPYGGTQNGRYPPHSGVEFWNPVDTPVVAVAGGTIYYAGTDVDVIFGPKPIYYGHLVVQQLDPTYNGQPVYALYGHVSEWYVETGQRVNQGDVIAGVGSAGIAIGPHLHFEVRIGNPEDFNSTRNPDLWIRPFYGYGTLAGRVVDVGGGYLPEVSITVRSEDAVRYTWTYASDIMNPDDEWGENFTMGDLPEGWYTVTTRSSRRGYEEQVYIHSGQTSWIEFVFD